MRLLKVLKWYFDENRLFPIEAILKHKEVVCMRGKMHFTFFQISLFVPEIFMVGGRAPTGELCNKVCMYVCMYVRKFFNYAN